MKTKEHEIQSMYFLWVRLNERRHPALQWTHAVPNGGFRDIRTARRLKAEGVKAGIWDVVIPYPARKTKHVSDSCCQSECFAGAYIEFKADKNILTKEQRAFEEYAFKYYDLFVAYDWIGAAQFTERYLGLNKTA